MSSQIARKVVTTFRQESPLHESTVQLSPREEEVLRFLAKGLRSKEIAKNLEVSVGTVNTYVRHIYENFMSARALKQLHEFQIADGLTITLARYS
jgi:DNA-binding NarL/FixJ family response regulator